MQRVGEFRRMLDAARADLQQVAERLPRLTAELPFLDVYRHGEWAEEVKTLQETGVALSDAYARLHEQFERLARVRSFWVRFDDRVAVARLQDDVAALRERLTAWERQLDAFRRRLEGARAQVERWSNTWRAIREQITKLCGELPAAWQRAWQDLDQRLARLAAEPDEAARRAGLAQVKMEIAKWERAAEQLAVWAEWRQEAASRMPILDACLAKLASLQLAHSRAAEDVRRLKQEASDLAAMSAEQAASPDAAWSCAWLRRATPEVLRRASQVVALAQTPDPHALRVAAARAADQVQTLAAWLRSPEAKTLAEHWRRQDASRYAAFRARCDAALAEADAALAGAGAAEHAGASGSPAVRAEDVDRLLAVRGTLSELRSELEHEAAAFRSEEAELGARRDALQRRLADALAQLAAAGLADSAEYQKLSAWQERLWSVADEEELSRYERWLSEELRVVAALLSHREEEETLRRRADELAARHQGWQAGWPDGGWAVPAAGPYDTGPWWMLAQAVATAAEWWMLSDLLHEHGPGWGGPGWGGGSNGWEGADASWHDDPPDDDPPDDDPPGFWSAGNAPDDDGGGFGDPDDGWDGDGGGGWDNV